MAIGKTIRWEVFARDGFTCQYCGLRPPGVALEIDHIHPVAKGGTDELLNLITSCSYCNNGKGVKVISVLPGREGVRPQSNYVNYCTSAGLNTSQSQFLPIKSFKRKTATLYWHCKTPKGWRRFPVVMGGSGRIRLGAVIEDGVERKYPKGSFHLRTYEGRRIIYRNVGTNAAEAVAALHLERCQIVVKRRDKGTGMTVRETVQ